MDNPEYQQNIESHFSPTIPLYEFVRDKFIRRMQTETKHFILNDLRQKRQMKLAEMSPSEKTEQDPKTSESLLLKQIKLNEDTFQKGFTQKDEENCEQQFLHDWQKFLTAIEKSKQRPVPSKPIDMTVESSPLHLDPLLFSHTQTPRKLLVVDTNNKPANTLKDPIQVLPQITQNLQSKREPKQPLFPSIIKQQKISPTSLLHYSNIM